MAASSLASYLKHYTIIGYVLDHEIGAAFLLHFSRGEMEFFLVPVTLKDGRDQSCNINIKRCLLRESFTSGQSIFPDMEDQNLTDRSKSKTYGPLLVTRKVQAP